MTDFSLSHSSGNMAQDGALFMYGNPLLDILTECDKDFLDKYKLEANNAILADETHKDLYDDMCEKYSVEYTPGGATQNTARVTQWIVGTPNVVTYVGCVSDDKYGDIMYKNAREAGVNIRYQKTDKEKTGTCAVLVTGQGKNRSLVANLAAANLFSTDHLDVTENRNLVEKAQFYYCAGFPITACPAAMEQLATHASKQGKKFCLNLSAPFIVSVFKEPLNRLLPHTDYLFGNESEATEFAKANDFGTTDIKEIALKAAALPIDGGGGRTVIITQGADPTVVACDNKVTEFPVIPIKAEDIVDTNGAGDAFVGGFLAQLIQGSTLEENIRCAHFAANVVIRRSGASLPDTCDYK